MTPPENRRQRVAPVDEPRCGDRSDDAAADASRDEQPAVSQSTRPDVGQLAAVVRPKVPTAISEVLTALMRGIPVGQQQRRHDQKATADAEEAGKQAPSARRSRSSGRASPWSATGP